MNMYVSLYLYIVTGTDAQVQVALALINDILAQAVAPAVNQVRDI